MLAAAPLALLAAALLAAGDANAADVERVEVLGAAPLGAGEGGGHAPRDRALRDALANAVREVAREQLSGVALEPSPEAIDAALGADPFEYASRFRVLEDRGAQPASRALDPSAASEYVVLAEVHVDAVRVRRRLASAGFLDVPSGDGRGYRTRIAIEELTSWGEIQAVRQLLRDVGASDALPVEVERGRAVLEFESPRAPERLLQELVRRAPEGLTLEPLGAGPEGLRVRARLAEPLPPAAEAFDTPEAERY